MTNGPAAAFVTPRIIAGCGRHSCAGWVRAVPWTGLAPCQQYVNDMNATKPPAPLTRALRDTTHGPRLETQAGNRYRRYRPRDWPCRDARTNGQEGSGVRSGPELAEAAEQLDHGARGVGGGGSPRPRVPAAPAQH